MGKDENGELIKLGWPRYLPSCRHGQTPEEHHARRALLKRLLKENIAGLVVDLRRTAAARLSAVAHGLV
jgi:hypothetical protein